MTEPSDEQVIADAMLLGVRFERTFHGYARCTLPDGREFYNFRLSGTFARAALNELGYEYRDGVLVKRAV